MLSQLRVSSIDNLRESIRSTIDRIVEPTPRFRFLVGWAENYDALLQDSFTEETDIREILQRSREVGRVLVCGKGGGGKTVILHRLARLAFEEGSMPFFLDLKRWTAQHYSRWAECQYDNVSRVKFLLENFAVPRTTPAALDAIPVNVERFLLVDGLNEVISSTGKEISDVLDEFVRFAVRTSLVITDRMTRRQFQDASRWCLGAILPLDESEIRSHLLAVSYAAEKFDNARPSERALLTTPYFLDAVLKSGYQAPSSSRVIHDYLITHATLAEVELDQAAFAAFSVYETAKARTFPLEVFEAHAGSGVTRKLVEAGVIIKEGDLAFFDHHLRHDYLASRYVAKNPDSAWVHSAFDVVTLDASSFDALALSLEQLAGSDESDQFVRRIYDWNLYGAAYSVTEGRYRVSVNVSDEMEIFLLAMLAERKWDLILSTARRACDALRLFPNPNAADFLKTANLNEIFQLVDRVQTAKKWFSDWRSIFTREPFSETTDEELLLIKDVDSVKGWTYANVLKRLRLTLQQQRILTGFLDDPREAVRWRIAHVLGSFPSQENADILLRLFDSDPYIWVRFGAIRSLIESAVLADAPLRATIFAKIETRAEVLSQNAKCLREFEQSIFVARSRAPEDWSTSSLGVIEGLRRSVSSFGERERFQILAYKLKEQYGI